MDNIKNDRYHISKLIENIDFVLKYTDGVAREEFANDEILLDSVSFRLIQISECANQVSDSYKSIHPEIPWNEIKGLRNRLVHDYGNIDFNVIEQTVYEDIPVLKELLANIG